MSGTFIIENDVLIGGDGHLFLAQGAHSVLDLATGKSLVSPDGLRSLQQNILTRRTYLDELGIGYFHLIFPDKQSVLKDKYVTTAPICLAEEFAREYPGVQEYVLNATPNLSSSTQPPFMKCDTHLSDYGTLRVVAEVVERITNVSQTISLERFEHQKWHPREISGDLGGKLEPKRSSSEMFVETFWKSAWIHNDIPGGNNGLVDIRINPHSEYKLRLAFFGDSFGREACKFLSYFFSELIFLRTPFLHREIVEAYRPNYVITSNVERYINSTVSDEYRPWFSLFPHILGRNYHPNVEFSTAFSSLLSFPRVPYVDFMDKISRSITLSS